MNAERNNVDVLSSWSKQETLCLIKELKKHSILYKAHPSDHLQGSKKREAIKLIVNELKQIKPNVDEKKVKIKLKTLTQQLNRERKKILRSKRSGADTSAVYKPTLWCFEELSFLLHVNDEHCEASNMSEITNSSVKEEDCAAMESQPMNLEEPTDSDVERFARTADRSLQIMERMMTNMQWTKEDAFCQYLSAELKALKLEESFDEVQLAVVMSLQTVKAKERKFFQQNEMHRGSSSPPPSPSLSTSTLVSLGEWKMQAEPKLEVEDEE